MDSIVRDMVENMMRLETKIKKIEEDNKKKDTEFEVIWKALVRFKKIVYEQECEIAELRIKMERLGKEKRREMESIWTELEGWNEEWAEHKRLTEEKEKMIKFNEKRDEELRDINNKYTKESIRSLWSTVRRNEDYLGLAKSEARKLVEEMWSKIDELGMKEGKREAEDAKEKNEQKNRMRKNRLAVTWPEKDTEEKKINEEGQE